MLSFDEPDLDERRRLLDECERLLRELANEAGLGWVTYLRGMTFIEEQNPSAENVARYCLQKLAAKLNDDRVQIYKVRCFETPTSVATYQID